MIISQNIMTVDAVYSYNGLQGNFLVWATWFFLKKDSARETCDLLELARVFWNEKNYMREEENNELVCGSIKL